jgi:hypothetical protein
MLRKESKMVENTTKAEALATIRHFIQRGKPESENLSDEQIELAALQFVALSLACSDIGRRLAFKPMPEIQRLVNEVLGIREWGRRPQDG